jgi:DNA-binding beta-propeller fold protein YncE
VVFATGLKNPSKIITGPAGTLLVTEADMPPNSGRISRIDSSGSRQILIDGLPSGLAPPENSPDGPNGLALDGRTLYIAIGEGDGHISGPRPGSLVPNPNGPSSPIFSTILQVTFNNDIDKLNGAFPLAAADQFTLADHNPVTLTNGSGDQATIRLLAEFRPNRPDPASIYRQTHLYGLALIGSLYVVDAGNNSIWQVDTTSGWIQLVTRFPNTPNPTMQGPPTSEAVPTSIHPYGNQLLVSLLSGAPFVPGASRLMVVDPLSGTTSVLLPNLSSTIDTLLRVRPNGSTQVFTLEYSLNLTSDPPAGGQLSSYTAFSGQVLAGNLPAPSSMALDPATGKIYITSRSDGTVLVVNAGV